MAKSPQKKSLIETMTFDNYSYARDTQKKAQKALAKIKTGLIVAAAATVFSLAGFIIGVRQPTVSGFLFLFAIAGSIAAYIIGGGFSTALGAAKKAAFIGWVVCPFPLDILTGLITMFVAIYCFFMVPIIFVYISYRQQSINLHEATEFLKYCKSAEQDAPAEVGGVNR